MIYLLSSKLILEKVIHYGFSGSHSSYFGYFIYSLIALHLMSIIKTFQKINGLAGQYILYSLSLIKIFSQDFQD